MKRSVLAVVLAPFAGIACAQTAAPAPSAPPPVESMALQVTGPPEYYGVYKHIDAQGKVTYTNFPVKGGQKLELEPLSVVPVTPANARVVPGTTLKSSTGLSQPAAAGTPQRPPVAVVSAPSVDTQTQKKRDDQRRLILENELKQEEKLLTEARARLTTELKDAEALKLTLAQMESANITSADARKSVEKNQARLSSSQQTVDDHSRNVEALKRLSALKP